MGDKHATAFRKGPESPPRDDKTERGSHMNARPKELQFKIHNIHCAGCEVVIERKFKSVPGVASVRVSHVTGRADVVVNGKQPGLDVFERAITDNGYSVSWWHDHSHADAGRSRNNTRKDYAEIGAIVLFLFAAYLILKQTNLLPGGLGISKDMSYGFVFLMGVVAAFSSCLAVTGGLLLAVAAKYNESHPDLTGFEKFKPTVYFNIGRVVSYTILGGVVGAIGSTFTLSSSGTGFLSILASLVMIMLGFQLLNLFPWMRRFQPKMPKFISHPIHDLSSRDGKSPYTPLTLGAATFFLPCGFTQALQFYVLSTGSPTKGALTMLAFSLGTLPSLLSLSMISSFARGSFQKHFLRFAAVLVIFVGFWNISNGLTLAGIDLPFQRFRSNVDVASEGSGLLVPVAYGVQTVNMTVDGYDYSPHQFSVQAGVPVKWRIDARNAAGCAQVLISSSLGIVKYLSPDGETTISFTPKEPGTYSFSCPMGMTTYGAAFKVVPRDPKIRLPDSVASNDNTSDQASAGAAYAGPSQKLFMEISEENGFYPNTFTVKKGIPVDMKINDKVQLGGCMTVMVIPEYQATVMFKIGENALSFTPTGAGTVYGTCSMGTKIIQLKVTD
ncbi:urease accessory protein UreH domain-containing protein (plasmid) [Mesorhizobium atlanticum]|jgi:sulfite exporter TauE/SafE/plastocyanin domain-containing protein/copper chaperone CopZ|uniref:urease accessory protein UreH domain-containing protein n=1 Tax=Mesorhizobium atlanticum TaxID=2233532 RepID=UPI003704B5B8